MRTNAKIKNYNKEFERQKTNEASKNKNQNYLKQYLNSHNNEKLKKRFFDFEDIYDLSPNKNTNFSNKEKSKIKLNY